MRYRALTAAAGAGLLAVGGYFFHTNELKLETARSVQTEEVLSETDALPTPADDEAVASPEWEDEASPMAEGEDSADLFATVRVFYGTDRGRTGSNKPGQFYGSERNQIEVGFCDVSIPKNHQVGRLESPKIWRFEFRENPERHVVLLKVEPVESSLFFDALQSTIRESYDARTDVGGEAFVFVHGFNVTFEDAARRTAQIAYDLNFPGAPLMYSWPALGRSGLLAYRSDAEMAKFSELDVAEFIAAVAQRSGARKIHVIAHSMGNRLVTGALQRVTPVLREADIPRFNQVILTAPDIDSQTFKEEIAPKIVNSAERITIYASSNDVALMASSLVNRFGNPRLGQGGVDLTVFPEYQQIEVVDASDVDTSLFGHSYHADNRSVLSDIRLVFDGRKAVERGLEAIRRNAAWRMSGGNPSVGGRAERIRR